MVIETVEQGNGTIVLAFKGRCDFQSRHTYQTVMNQALAKNPQLIIFDFTHLSYIDSAGLGLLNLTRKQQADHHIRFVIAAPQAPIKQILDITNMDQLFPVCSSLESALKTGFLAP